MEKNGMISKLAETILMTALDANGWDSLVEGPFKEHPGAAFFRQTNEGRILLAPGATNMKFAYKSGTSICAPAIPVVIRVIQKWRESEKERAKKE